MKKFHTLETRAVDVNLTSTYLFVRSHVPRLYVMHTKAILIKIKMQIQLNATFSLLKADNVICSGTNCCHFKTYCQNKKHAHVR